MSTLSDQLVSMLVPSEVLSHFDLVEIREASDSIRLRLEEKPDQIPPAMYRKKKAVLDGFCNPLELQTYPVKGKAVYLQLFRRRWKENAESRQHFSNTYDFHEPGMKATRDFGAFLKETFRS